MIRDLNATDLYGLSRLTVQAVTGTTDLVEQLHHTIARVSAPVGRASGGRTRGITGLVYGSIRGVTGLVGTSLDLAYRHLPRGEPLTSSQRREKLLSVLNGVLGDHLEASANPLAIPMRLHHRGQALELDQTTLASSIAQPTSRLLIAIHGLCLNHQCWTPGQGSHDIDMPTRLSAEHGFTDLHLHYNTGRAIARNGRDLDTLLEKLLTCWPVPVEEIVLLGHSMGGLVSRSACHYGCESGHRWPERLRRMIFLGSPHHGSPLERAGHGLERLLGISPYSAPFQRLGRIRSAGITDLRHGRVIEADVDTNPGHSLPRLPGHVVLHSIAATRAERADHLTARLIGDGLVPVSSALGHHRDPARCLPIAPEYQHILPATNHIALLHHPDAFLTVKRWLA